MRQKTQIVETSDKNIDLNSNRNHDYQDIPLHITRGSVVSESAFSQFWEGSGHRVFGFCGVSVQIIENIDAILRELAAQEPIDEDL